MYDNVYDLENLSDKQKQALNLLLSGSSNEDVAKRLKVNINTIYRWKRQDPFKSVLRDKQDALIEDIINELQPLGIQAVETLKDLIFNASNENNKLKASMYIIDKLIQSRDAELLNKIEEIESVLRIKGF